MGCETTYISDCPRISMYVCRRMCASARCGMLGQLSTQSGRTNLNGLCAVFIVVQNLLNLSQAQASVMRGLRVTLACGRKKPTIYV